MPNWSIRRLPLANPRGATREVAVVGAPTQADALVIYAEVVEERGWHSPELTWQGRDTWSDRWYADDGRHDLRGRHWRLALTFTPTNSVRDLHTANYEAWRR